MSEKVKREERRKSGRYSATFSWSLKGVAAMITACTPIIVVLWGSNSNQVVHVQEKTSQQSEAINVIGDIVTIDHERRFDLIDDELRKLRDLIGELEDRETTVGSMPEFESVMKDDLDVPLDNEPLTQRYKYRQAPKVDDAPYQQNAFSGAVEYILHKRKKR